MSPGELLSRAGALAHANQRRLLGITGPPGAGKSSLAQWLAGRLDGCAQLPMDGFHRSNQELEAAGLRQRKGAPETFDAEAFVAAVTEVRRGSGRELLLPGFDRDREETVPGMITIPAGARLVVVEGNYLLVETGPWAALPTLLDECWYLDIPDPIRRERLIERRRLGGASTQEAVDWTVGSDEANARLVSETAPRATLRVRLDGELW